MTEPSTASLDAQDNQSRASAPSGADGPTSDRGADGRFLRSNRAALIVGARSAAFWAAQDDARREIRRDVLNDKGYTEIDAPRALGIAADGIAQAVLLRDSAFLRMVESGGPLTHGDRARRSFGVWQSAGDRLERYLRLVGLDRAPKPTTPLSPSDWIHQGEQHG